MTNQHRPITREEIAMTPQAILAEAIAFRDRPLTTHEVEDIVDSGDALGDDFAQVEGKVLDGSPTIRWRYVGDRWEVAFRDGRPVLVEAGTAPRSHRAMVERRFGLMVWTMRIVNARPLTDAEVATLRADPGWVEEFEAAEDADRRLSEFRRQEGPEAEVARERLERLRRIVFEHGLHPTGDWAEDETADDESTMGRYATILEGLDSRGREEHEVFFCDDLVVLMERALSTSVIGARHQGSYDLDAESDDPLVMVCEVRVESPGGGGQAIERVLPFLAAEGRPE